MTNKESLVTHQSFIAFQKRLKKICEVFVGKLPSDFLRLSSSQSNQSHETLQELVNYPSPLTLREQLLGMSYGFESSGKLIITIVQAKLVKNYGMTRMDPYVRLRVGHNVYETHTDPNGGKNPRWNKIIKCLLPHGIKSMYFEIFDECSFTMDELIAWAHIRIPDYVLNGGTNEEWFPLSGKQGEGLEGMINLVISFSPGDNNLYSPVSSVLDVGNSSYNLSTVPVSYNPIPITQVVPAPQAMLSFAQDLKQIEEMFPNIEKDVVKSVYEANRGNKDLTINSLLQMSD